MSWSYTLFVIGMVFKIALIIIAIIIGLVGIFFIGIKFLNFIAEKIADLD
jgi:hypothetical protein